MTSQNHTPGPWATDGKRIYIPGDGQIARVTEATIGRSPIPAANAHLIAAAPEMLQALDKIAECSGAGSIQFEIAKKAIAKARGLIK